MKRIVSQLLLAVCVLACSACATTAFESTWKSPAAKPLRLRDRKVVAVFVSRDPLLRRRAEDAMAWQITARGAVGVASYTFLSDSEVRDQETAQAKAARLGFAAAAVMRVVGRETQYLHEPHVIIWARPPYGRIWGDYWRWGWGTVWEPGYLREERAVNVETLVYSLEDDQLVWAGVSRTFEPLRIESFIAELALAVSEQMARDGLIARE
jgi:hypothetical protein